MEMKEIATVGLREKIGYGLGDAASSMFWKLFTMYLLFFYTDIIGLPAAAIGTMFLVTRIWDAFVDPLMGIMTDRTDTRWGKFRPYILFGAVPFGIIGILTFAVPEFGQSGKMIYAYVTYGLMMMIYSAVNVPYASLMGVMSPDPKIRTELSSYRMTFAFVGSILVLLLVEPLVEVFGRMRGSEIPDARFGWQMAAIVFAIIAVSMFFCTFAWTRERVKPIKETKNRLRDDLIDLFRNRPWWILLGAGVAAQIFNSIRDGSAVYYFKYYAEGTEGFRLGIIDASVSLTTIYLVLGQAANILGIILVTPISNRIGKKHTYLWSMVFATVLSACFYMLDKSDIGGMLLLQFLISMCAGAVFPLLWSMYADVTDFSELKTGRRATGLIFSSSSMSQKFGWTIAGALTGWLLGYFGFEANVVQTDTAQHGIRLMMSLLPAVGTLLSVLFIAFYPLNEKTLNRILEELSIRRKQ